MDERRALREWLCGNTTPSQDINDRINDILNDISNGWEKTWEDTNDKLS